jgi:CHAT domain-containing protein
MSSLVFFRSSILAALTLAMCLWFTDTSVGFGPSIPNATVRPGSPQRIGPSGSGRITPSTVPNLGRRIAPSMAPNWGGGQPGFGFGIYIGPRRPIPERDNVTPPSVQFSEPEGQETRIERPPKRFSRRVQRRPLVKLAKPRVPYLSELAMNIKPCLISLVRQDPVKAVRVYKRALREAERSKNPKREWAASTDLGHVYYLTGRFAQAAAHYSRSGDISRQQCGPACEGIALRNLGATSTASGDYRCAEKQDLAALQRFKSTPFAKDAQMTLNNLGVLEKNRGRYLSAAHYYKQALDVTHDPSRVRALVLRNLGNFRTLWGEYDRAVDDYTAYGNLSASLGNQTDAAEACLDAASVYARQGLYDRAVAKVQHAIQIQSKAKINPDWSKKLMGDLLLDMGRPAEAEHYITEAGYDSSAGLLYLVKSQPQIARKHYERLLDAAAKEQNLDEMLTAHTGLGKVYEATQDYARAEHYYAKAVTITEEIRASLLLSDRRNFFAEKVNGFARSEPAKGLARVALKRNNPAAAIYAGEVTKAREFADDLSVRADGHHFGVSPEVLQKDAELTNRLAALKAALNAVPRGLDSERFNQMVNQIRQEDLKRKAFLRTLCQNCKEYCSVKYPQPVRLPDARINDAEYVLLFDVLGGSVGITLLKGKQVVKSQLVPWQTDDLEKQVRKLRAPFEQVQLTRFSPELAEAFYKRLLAEALKSVPRGSSITIIPDGALALLPFEALVAEGKPVWKHSAQGDYPAELTYVADLYPIDYYQSLTAMTLVRTLGRDTRSGKSTLVMVDPVFSPSDERLHGAAGQIPQPGEAREGARPQHALGTSALGGFRLRRLAESEKLGMWLKGLLGANCQLYTGLQCTKATFFGKVGQNAGLYNAVVFGTHGFAANDLPGFMEPVLALTMVPRGTDGFLTMSEVAGMRMDVDIAALIACKTGLGMRMAGEGVMSMGRAFQAAGAKSVLISLWSVAGQPSILLMEEFFKGLAQGRDKLTAWTDARAHIRREGFEHPFFWASFILVGEAN